MTMIQNFVARFRRDEDGASMVEYAVAPLVVTGIGITAMAALGTNAGAITTDACGVLALADAATATC